MKVLVNIDNIGESLDDIIEEKLLQAGLPACFGNMIPPLLVRELEMEDSIIMQAKGKTPADQISAQNLSSIIVGATAKENIKKTDLVLLKEAEEYINNYKYTRAQEYVRQVTSCAVCAFVDTCCKLTRNYLKFLEVEEHFKSKRRETHEGHA